MRIVTAMLVFVMLMAGTASAWVDPAYSAPEMPAITLDANLVEWSGAAWQNMNQWYDGSPSVVSAKWAVGWNYTTQKLYFAAEVEELGDVGDNFVLGDLMDSWNGEDHLEIYVQGDGTRNYDSFAGAQQYMFCPQGLAADGETYNGYFYWGDLVTPVGGGTIPNPNVQFASQIVGNKAIFEAVITVWNINNTAAFVLNGGKTIGFDVAYTDVDNTLGSITYSGMACANIAIGKAYYPDQFAKLVLSGTTVEACGEGQWTYRVADLNTDCKVNIEDFALLAQNWMICTSPLPPCSYMP